MIHLLGAIIAGIGGLGLLLCGLWMLIEQFKSGILWGIGCIFIPFISFIWLVLHWSDGKTPFLYGLGCGAVFYSGLFLTSI